MKVGNPADAAPGAIGPISNGNQYQKVQDLIQKGIARLVNLFPDLDFDAADIDAVLGLGSEGLDDSLYDQAVAIVAKDRKCSTSYIQRKLGIGYNKAAKLVEQMEEEGVVTRANHVGKREILIPEH